MSKKKVILSGMTGLALVGAIGAGIPQICARK